MNFQEYYASWGSYAKDIKLNISSLLKEDATSGLTINQIFGIALSSAYSCQSKGLIETILSEGENILSAEEIEAAKSAATIMAMNNIYYRFLHLTEDKEYSTMSAQLRMSVIANPGIPKVDFELYALAVSVLNGCGMCIDAHVKAVQKENISKKAIQSTVRIASVIHAAKQAAYIAEL